MNTQFATVNLEVRDVWRSVTFYTRVLGMELDGKRSHPPTFAYLRSPGCALTLTTPTESAGPEPSSTTEFGFETDDLAAFKKHLSALAVTDAAEQTMGWGSAVELRDPDGYRVIVYELSER